MDIGEILKDLMSPRSAGTTTKTPTSVSSGSGGRNGFGRMGSGGGKSARIASRLPESFVEDGEDSTIVHLLPTETEEETEEYCYDDDDDDNGLLDDIMDDDDDNESFIIQHPSGIENTSTNIQKQSRHHHQETSSLKLNFREQQLHQSPNHYHTSPPASNSPGPTTTSTMVGTGTTHCQQQQQQQHSLLARNQPHIIPSLLSCSEDDTEQEEEEDEDSTIIRPLPGYDDTNVPPAKAVLTDATNTANFHQLWHQQLQQTSNGSCNSSRSLPIQEVIVKNKKKKDKDDDKSKGGGGVEIVDVIMEHFAFSPRWDNDGAAGERGFGDGGDAAARNKNAAVDDESTVIQLLPGGQVHDDDEVSDIAFADKQMHQSKKGKNGTMQQSSSKKKKAATVAAVFVTLTVCLGVGYKAGNIMTSKSSSSSSSSSLAFTSLTPEDCLALRNATTTHGDGDIGKQSNKLRREQGHETFPRRSLEESDWKRIFAQCDEILGPQQQTKNELSNNSTSTSSSYHNHQSETQNKSNVTKYTIFRSKALKQGKSSKKMTPKQQLNTTKEQKDQKQGSKSIKSPPDNNIIGESPSSSNTTSSFALVDSATPTSKTEKQPSPPSGTEGQSSNSLTPTEHCPSVGQRCKGTNDCCQGEKCCHDVCIGYSVGGKDAPCL